MFKRLLSFLVPVRVHSQKSVVSKTLEVTWANGQLVLDSLNTNYSYGNLQRILRVGMQHIGFPNIRKMEQVLVLGVAGGSVIRTLNDEIKYTGKITGVEIDPDVIALANQYFRLDKIENLELVIDDAFEYVLKTNQIYDLIIVDIFRDTAMPNFLFERFFTDRISGLLAPGGYILFNTMIVNNIDESRNEAYLEQFDPGRFNITALARIQKHNELFVIQRRS